MSIYDKELEKFKGATKKKTTDKEFEDIRKRAFEELDKELK